MWCVGFDYCCLVLLDGGYGGALMLVVVLDLLRCFRVVLFVVTVVSVVYLVL